MNPLIRLTHRRIAPWLVAPLLVSLLTGLTYRIGRSWFGMSKPFGERVLELHTGKVFGEWGALAYTAFTGLGLLTLALGGGYLLWRSRAKAGARRAHRVVAWLLLLPLVATALTGLAYQFGASGFGFDESTLKLLLSIHQGSWLGPRIRPFYILLVGGGLLLLIVSGVGLLRAKTRLEKVSAESAA